MSASSRAATAAWAAGAGVSVNSQAIITDLETALGLLELRPTTHYPLLLAHDYSAGHLLAAGGDITLLGAGLLGGTTSPQTFASYVIDETGTAGGKITLHALKPGICDYTCEFVAGSGALSIAFDGTKLTVTLAAGGSTAADICTAINANAASTDGYIRAVATTAGTMSLAHANTAFTEGTGSGKNFNKVLINNQECLPANETGTGPTAKWSETSIVVTVPALTGLATDDTADVYVIANGRASNHLGVKIVAA